MVTIWSVIGAVSMWRRGAWMGSGGPGSLASVRGRRGDEACRADPVQGLRRSTTMCGHRRASAGSSSPAATTFSSAMLIKSAGRFFAAASLRIDASAIRRAEADAFAHPGVGGALVQSQQAADHHRGKFRGEAHQGVVAVDLGTDTTRKRAAHVAAGELPLRGVSDTTNEHRSRPDSSSSPPRSASWPVPGPTPTTGTCSSSKSSQGWAPAWSRPPVRRPSWVRSRRPTPDRDRR